MKCKASPRAWVSTHAIHRYRERVEHCTKADAQERMLHAYQISRPPTEKQIQWMMKKQFGGKGAMYRWCEVETLMLVLVRLENGELLIKTVFRVPCDEECRYELRERHRRKKHAKKPERQD